MKKKKGFTLIELIVALAIFAISTSAIATMVNTSSNIYSIEDKKISVITSAQKIMQGLKSNGAEGLKKFYENETLKAKTGTYFYIFFDNRDRLLESKIKHGGTEEKAKPIILDETKYIKTGKDSTGNYEECSKNNTQDKKYGALIQITKETEEKYYGFDTYKLKVEVWDLRENGSIKSDLSVSLSR